MIYFIKQFKLEKMFYKIGFKYYIFKVKNDYKILFLNDILYLDLKLNKYIINYVTNSLFKVTFQCCKILYFSLHLIQIQIIHLIFGFRTT